MWFINTTSRQFTAEELRLLFKYAGYCIEKQEQLDEAPLKPDAPCEFYHEPFLAGITNGEYLWCLDEILAEMLSASPAIEPPAFKQAVMASLFQGLKEDFLDEDVRPDEIHEIWPLWAARRADKKLLWLDKDGDPAPTPPLHTLKSADWELVLDILADDLTDEHNYSLGFRGDNFALHEVQPLWPTYQQFRSAKARILRACVCASTIPPAGQPKTPRAVRPAAPQKT